MKLDNKPTDYFGHQVSEAIKSGSFEHEGWSLQVNHYRVFASPYGHTSIELYGPNGSNFYAAIDTYVFKEGKPVGYHVMGGTLQLCLDQCREDNLVVKGKPNARKEILTGNGQQVISKFIAILEQAEEFNRLDIGYNLASINSSKWIPTIMALFNFKSRRYFQAQDRQCSNSNSAPIKILEILGLDVTELRNKRHGRLFCIGADDKIDDIKLERRKTSLSDQLATADQTTWSKLMDKIRELGESMHPDSIHKNTQLKIKRYRTPCFQA